MSAETELALADRIRAIIDDMPGKDHGKQAELARIAGCGRPVVNHWLSGQTVIKYEHAKNIADHFGYRLEWVREGKGPRKPGEREMPEKESGEREEALYMRLSVDEVKLITHYRAATSAGKALIDLSAASVPKDVGEKHH